MGLTALAGVTVLTLAACGSSSSSSASSGSTPTSTSTSSVGSTTSGSIVWSASPLTGTGANDARTVLINAFEKQYPNIHVTLVSASTDTDTNRATLATQIAGGSSSPDVFMGDVIWPAQFGAHQLAVPLSQYLPSSYWSKFAPGLVAGATYKGAIYGSPLFEDQGFLYYRKDLLTKDGLPVPKTWEQLETDAKAVLAKGQTKYGFVWEGDSYEGLTCDFMEYLTDAGGTATNSTYTTATLNSAAALKAVTFMRGLVTSGVTPAAVTTFQEPQAMTTFGTGQAVFLRNWDYAYSAATTPSSGGKLTASQVGVEPLPTFAGQSTPGYSNIGGWNMYINPHSTHIGADLTFIQWLSSTAAQDILSQRYGFISTVQSVRTSPAVIASNPVFAVVPLTKLVPRPAGTPEYPALSTAIYTNVNSALAGSSSPAAAVAAMQSSATTALSSTSSGGL
ncbi:MAG TPA: ABC transporter substrate-binding protein [Streptosporangiaceae bacterium]|nr:ABC transporter substrate-binding protein [Streptosporangiaceae bacterium]